MEYCDICGKAMKRTVWKDEAWGRPYTTVEWSCENPHCGETVECRACHRDIHIDEICPSGLCEDCDSELEIESSAFA